MRYLNNIPADHQSTKKCGDAQKSLHYKNVIFDIGSKFYENYLKAFEMFPTAIFASSDVTTPTLYLISRNLIGEVYVNLFALFDLFKSITAQITYLNPLLVLFPFDISKITKLIKEKSQEKPQQVLAGRFCALAGRVKKPGDFRESPFQRQGWKA